MTEAGLNGGTERKDEDRIPFFISSETIRLSVRIPIVSVSEPSRRSYSGTASFGRQGPK